MTSIKSQNAGITASGETSAHLQSPCSESMSGQCSQLVASSIGLSGVLFTLWMDRSVNPVLRQT